MEDSVVISVTKALLSLTILKTAEHTEDSRPEKAVSKKQIRTQRDRQPRLSVSAAM